MMWHPLPQVARFCCSTRETSSRRVARPSSSLARSRRSLPTRCVRADDGLPLQVLLGGGGGGRMYQWLMRQWSTMYAQLLREEKPWELQFNNMQPSVWYDEASSTWKAWYSMFSTCLPASAKSCQAPKHASACDSNMGYDAKSRTGSLCYAESRDGKNWTKPGLGLVPFGKTPATQTNIVLGDAPSSAQPLSGGYPTGNGVTLDEASPSPAERWKMLGCRPKTMFDAYLATSTDGLHWSNGTQFVAGRFDTALNVQFDSYSRRWLAFARQARTRVRSKMHSTIRYQSVAVSRDENFLGQWEPMLPTLLNTSTLNYQPDALVSFAYEGVFLGFANMLALSANRSENGGLEGGTVLAELVFSPDGRTWQYLKPGVSFLPLGKAGERSLSICTGVTHSVD
jgi:hypothetical protein